jgi:hypothetical protein
MGGGGSGGDSGSGGSGSVDASVDEVPQVISPFISIGIGRAHVCGVRFNGAIACKGDNSKGQATPPAGEFSQVIAGGDHTCAQVVDHYDVMKNRSLVCWGDNSHGEATAPPGPMDSAVAGERHNCVISSGVVKCWGDNTSGQSAPPAFADGMVILGIAAGRAHTCALLLDMTTNPVPHKIVCWGDNARGQTDAPAIMPSDAPYEIRAASDHTCLSDFLGLTRCWGDNEFGQSTTTPSTIRELSTASGHTCGIPFGGFKNNQIFCWGNNWGDSTSTPPEGEFSWVVAGDYLNCALPAGLTSTNDKPLVCWGKTYEPWY